MANRTNKNDIILNNGRRLTESLVGMTPTKLTRTINDIKFKSDLKKLSLAEMEYTLATTTNKDIYEKILKVYNPKVKQYNLNNEDRKHWFNKAERSAKGIAQAILENKQANQEKKKEKRIENMNKLIEKTGLGKFQKNKFYEEYQGVRVYNPNMMNANIDTLIKNAKKIAEKQGYSEEEIEKYIGKIKDDFEDYKKNAGLDAIKSARIINEAYLDYTMNMLLPHPDSRVRGGVHQGYFGYVRGKEIELGKLKALLGKLNASELASVRNLVRSPEFLMIWCSDQECSTFDTDFRENRLDELIAIIENHIGKGAEYDVKKDKIVFYDLTNKNSTKRDLELKDF